MQQIYPNLTLNGQCEAAFLFYKARFHGKITFMMTYEKMPMDLQVPPEWRTKIGHAKFARGDWMFSGSDALPGQYQRPQGFGMPAIQWSQRDLQGLVGESKRRNATPGDTLGTSLRRTGGPVWNFVIY